MRTEMPNVAKPSLNHIIADLDQGKRVLADLFLNEKVHRDLNAGIGALASLAKKFDEADVGNGLLHFQRNG